MFILVILQYDYANNLGGRRTEIGKSGTMMAQSETQAYGYNVRDELISGQGLTYNYDAIGNRTIAEGKTYTANNLNQYTAIDSFTPQYDADGNQTLIKTSTGIWSVTYNAENRPVRWELGDTVVTMDFDRMGRRTFYKEMNGNTQVTFTRFVYKDYLCVRQVFSNSPYNTYKNFVWDPTETIATRPLKLQLPTMSLNLFYMHDGNKNVSDVVYRLTSNGVAAHYDYAPFGAVTRSVSNSVPTADITTLNPFRFSSEYHDDTLGLVYYNYRHYNPTAGRWISRDFLSIPTLYLSCENNLVNFYDLLGLIVRIEQSVETYNVASATDFLQDGMEDGWGKVTMEMLDFDIGFSTIQATPLQDYEKECADGECLFQVNGVVFINGTARIKTIISKFDSRSYESEERKRRIQEIITFIEKHEQSHQKHYIAIINQYNSLDNIKISKKICSPKGQTLSEVISNKMLNFLYQKLDVIDFQEDTTHNKMGMSINASDAVITGILTIAYPDGTEQSIEL